MPAERLQDVKLRLKPSTEQVAPALAALQGVGPDVASTLPLATGDKPERLVNQRPFASLRGVSPVTACSGKTTGTGPTGAGTDRPTPHCGAPPLSGCTDPCSRDYLA